MKRKYQLLVFDWDGTLMDSEAHIVASMQAVMRELSLEVLDRRTVGNIIGLGLHEAISTLFPYHANDDFVAAFTQSYRRYYFAPDAPQALFEGAEPIVRELHGQGYLLAVATGKSRRGLDRSLIETGLADVFHASRCADETASKPHPRMLEELLHELNVDPSDAVMIGDTEFDLEMARNAGMDAIGVSYGVHGPERLRRHAPVSLVDRITDLAQILSRQQRPGPIDRAV